MEEEKYSGVYAIKISLTDTAYKNQEFNKRIKRINKEAPTSP